MATELAKAYVQIIPSAKGISSSISKAMSPGLDEAGGQAGQTIGSNLVSKLKTVIATAGIGKAITAAINEGAELQQSIGGIETLFKDSYAQVEKYANEAYKTAGLSANNYMQQVTSFSASLLQSLGGDTAKAAKAANQALIDMSDNANKMGTDMESIQWAYQGFAKQNYTMLDNLKLGYGGTKEEMKRLLADAQKLTGVKYDIDNLSDVYEAIHVIQENLGITGTTAIEASTTYTGSLNSMRAALSNFLATLALGENGTMTIQQSMSALLSSAINFLLNNALPMLVNIITTFPTAIFTALGSYSSTGVQGYINQLFGFINTFFTARLPEMITLGLNTVANFITGLIQSLPDIINSAAELVTNLCTGMSDNFGAIIETAKNAIMTLVTGIIDNLPEIIKAGVNLVVSLVNGIISNLSKILESGIKLIIELGKGIVKAMPDLLAKIPGIISDIISGFSKIFDKIFDVGKNLVKGLWNGIKSVKDWVIDKIKGFGDSILEGIKDFFGISSPSKLMDKEVGTFMAQGVGTGFVGEMNRVKKEMENSLPRKFSVAPTLGYNYKVNGIGRTRYNLGDESVAGGRVQNNSTESKKYIIEIPINLDGKTLARETVSYTDAELAKRERLFKRGVMA